MTAPDVPALVARLRDFGEAYPLDIFPEPDTAERAWIALNQQGLQDRIAASMGRHFAKFAIEAADALTAQAAEIADLSAIAGIAIAEREKAMAEIERLREACALAVDHLNTYRGAGVDEVIDKLEALASRSEGTAP